MGGKDVRCENRTALREEMAVRIKLSSSFGLKVTEMEGVDAWCQRGRRGREEETARPQPFSIPYVGNP